VSLIDLSPEETAKADAMLAELHGCGYIDVDRHNKLAPGVRIRHVGHQWPGAMLEGSGVVLAIAEKPDSSWSRSWGMPDVELIAVWDRASFGSRVSQVAQYHVEAVPR